jgi:hypothetical protein
MNMATENAKVTSTNKHGNIESATLGNDQPFWHLSQKPIWDYVGASVQEKKLENVEEQTVSVIRAPQWSDC